MRCSLGAPLALPLLCPRRGDCPNAVWKSVSLKFPPSFLCLSLGIPPLKGQSSTSPLLLLWLYMFAVRAPKWMCLCMSCTCITFLCASSSPLSVCVNICHCMCLPVTLFLSHAPSLHLSLCLWMSEHAEWSRELITVGARKAVTKTLHRQHNSGGRHQTGSTQSSQLVQLSSTELSYTHRTANVRAAFTAMLKLPW